MHVFLETDRLVLRRFTPADAPALLGLDADPRVRRFVEDGDPVTLEAAADAIATWTAGYAHSDVLGFWAAEERTRGEFLGWFHLMAWDDEQRASPELGYRLTAAAWGKGYATEGSRAIIDRAFRSPAITRVVAEAMAIHTASRRVMEKAGMRHVRSFQAAWPVSIPGDEFGDVQYAITRDEWEAARQAAEDRAHADTEADQVGRRPRKPTS